MKGLVGALRRTGQCHAINKPGPGGRCSGRVEVSLVAGVYETRSRRTRVGVCSTKCPCSRRSIYDAAESGECVERGCCGALDWLECGPRAALAAPVMSTTWSSTSIGIVPLRTAHRTPERATVALAEEIHVLVAKELISVAAGERGRCVRAGAR